MSEKALKPALTDVGLRYNTKLADVLPPDLAEPLRTFAVSYTHLTLPTKLVV